MFQINAVLLNFLFIKESWKKVSTKILNSKNCFNNNNSEGSCDTDDWSNDVWKYRFDHRNTF